METRTTIKYVTPILRWLLSCLIVLHSSILLAESSWEALFATDGKVNAKKVSEWDGNHWTTSDSGMNDIINAFTIDSSGNLYAEGNLITVSNTNIIDSSGNVAKNDTPDNNVIGNNAKPENTLLAENNTQDSGIINNTTKPESTAPLTTEELFTKAQEAGIFNSINATIEWLSTNGISPEILTKEQRNILPFDWNPPLTMNNQPSATAILSDKMGNETVISIDNTVNVLLEPISGNEPSDEPIEVKTFECASNYKKIGSRLCLSFNLYGSARYRYAEYDCRQKHSGGRVADSADYFAVQSELGDESFNNYAIKGIWLGPRIADDQALYLNLVRWWDMDGQTSVFDFRYYKCAYDL